MRKPEKRNEIARAALELIAEHGFHGAPMALIAARAGVAAGSIYRYFANKDLLIIELYRDIEEKINVVLMEDYPPDKPTRERFLHLGKILLKYCIENPLHFRYLEQFHNSPYGTAYRRDKFLGKQEGCDIFRELFDVGVAQQMMKDLPLMILFALAFGPLLTVARDHILNFISLDEDLISKTVEACWDGVRR